MDASRKYLAAVFSLTFFYRLLFQILNGFPLKPDFFQRTSVMKDIAAGDQYTQFLNPELFYRLGSLVYYLPVDPVWFFTLATPVISALGIATVYYVTSEIFDREEGLYAAFALVVMSIVSFRSMVAWLINSYISAYIFLPLFLLTLFNWKRTKDPIHILTGSIAIVLIGGFHHLVFLETLALLGIAFFLVDRDVVLYLPAILLNFGLMWENYGRYLYGRGVAMINLLAANIESLLSSFGQPQRPPTPPADGGGGTTPGTPSGGTGNETAATVSQFEDSTILNVLSLMAMLNPFVLTLGGAGLIHEIRNHRERYDLGSRILLSWILAQAGMILFTSFVQPNATERTVRHLFIPFAMVFGVGFKLFLNKFEQRIVLSRVTDQVSHREVLIAVAVVLSIPMLVYQVAPFGGAGYAVHPDSEVVDGLEKVDVEGQILAPPLTDEVVGYYHDGPVFRTYPRDFLIPRSIETLQAKAWEWWDDPSKCHLLHELGIDWVFIDKRSYFDEYWNNPKNVRVPQNFNQSYLKVHYENEEMKLYEVRGCKNDNSI